MRREIIRAVEGNVSAGEVTIRAGEGTIRVGQQFYCRSNFEIQK